MMGRILDDSSKSATAGLWEYLGHSLGVVAVGSMASWLRVYCLQTSGKMISGNMKKQVFDSYIEKDINFFDSAVIGEMVTVMEKDVDQAAGVLTDNLAAGVRSFNSAVNGSLLLFRTSPQLCGIALSMTPVLGVGAMYISKITKSLTAKMREIQSESLNFAIEKFSNISTIRLNCQEASEKERFSGFISSSYDVASRTHFSDGALMGFINLSTNASLLVILFAGGRMIAKGQMTAGSLTRFAIQSAFVGLGFSGLSAFYGDTKRSLEAAARLVALAVMLLI